MNRFFVSKDSEIGKLSYFQMHRAIHFRAQPLDGAAINYLLSMVRGEKMVHFVGLKGELEVFRFADSEG
jgi:hypothetical protein